MPEAAAGTTTNDGAPNEGASQPTVDDGKGGKAAVLADLATERDKRQALEQQVTQLTQAQQAQTEALAKAFGLKSEETSDVSKLAEQVTQLREQFAQTSHDNVVLSVANEHGITTKEDIALLSAVKDEATMRSLAARIATGTAPGTPKPDLTQGGKADKGAATPEQDFAGFLSSQLGR